MSHAGAPSPLSLNSPSPAAGQASVAKNEPTSTEGSKSHSARTAAIAGSIGGVCALIVIVLVAVLFWRRRKRRVLREQQIAIRRMTIIGPAPTSSPPILPYPFVGHGPRTDTFTSDFEMSTSKGPVVSKAQEAGLPKAKPPVPPRSRNLDRVVRGNEQIPAARSAPADSASVFSSKQSDAGDGDGIAFVDGIYVLALNSNNGQHTANDRAASAPSK